jgi:hypothetical protein
VWQDGSGQLSDGNTVDPRTLPSGTEVPSNPEEVSSPVERGSANDVNDLRYLTVRSPLGKVGTVAALVLVGLWEVYELFPGIVRLLPHFLP